MMVSSQEVEAGVEKAYAEMMAEAQKKGVLDRDAGAGRSACATSPSASFRRPRPSARTRQKWQWEVHVHLDRTKSTPGACPAARWRSTPA